jgi:hypothetical protein
VNGRLKKMMAEENEVIVPDLTCVFSGTPDLRPDLTCVFTGTPDLRQSPETCRSGSRSVFFFSHPLTFFSKLPH